MAEKEHSGTRKIRVRFIKTDPIDGMEESDVVKIDHGKFILAVFKGTARPDTLQNLAEAIGRLSNQPVMALSIGKDDSFELWEEEEVLPVKKIKI